MPNYQNYSTHLFDDLKQLLRDSAHRYGERALLLEKNNKHFSATSYRRFAADVDALGTALLCRGWKNRRVLLLGENSTAWATAYMALICGVGTVIPIDCGLHTREIASIAKRTNAEAVICPDARAERLHRALPALDLLPLSALPDRISDGYRRIHEGDRSYLDAAVDPDALATVVMTSGSTSQARAVMLSHRNLCFALAEMCKMVYIDEQDIFLSVLPLHHIFETVCGLLCPIYRGAAVAFSEGLDHLTQNLREVRPTVMLCFPLLTELLYRNLCTHIRRLGLASRVALRIKLTDAIPQREARIAAKQRLLAPILKFFGGRLRLLVSGGDCVDPACLHGFRALGINAIQGYGMTECAALIALNRDTHPNDRSAGRSTPRTLLDICEGGDDGIGEIRFKGDNLMLGYLDDPEATARAIRGGWLHTGDLGMIDDEGFLYVIGRTKNIIRVGKKRVYPEELEELLTKNRYVAEAMVVGYAGTGRKTEPIAVIYPNPNRLKTLRRRHGDDAEQVLALELRRALAELNGSVAPHKRIARYLLRTEPFPKNAAGKLLRAGMADEVARQLRGES